jgi:hypothetical protein
VKIGDLIKISDLPQGDNRETGLVLGFDMYAGTMGPVTRPGRAPERIVEVQWNDGSIGWILQTRTEVISESR